MEGAGAGKSPGNRLAFGGGMRDVKAMSERDLAEYQSSYKTSTAEWKVCEEEFERRRGMPATLGRG
jgi:hypothetical protein